MFARRAVRLPALLCLAGSMILPETLLAQQASSSEVQSRIERVGACLSTVVVEKSDPHACQTLNDRMAQDRVPGVSIAVIHNGAIEWARESRRGSGRRAADVKNFVTTTAEDMVLVKGRDRGDEVKQLTNYQL